MLSFRDCYSSSDEEGEKKQDVKPVTDKRSPSPIGPGDNGMSLEDAIDVELVKYRKKGRDKEADLLWSHLGLFEQHLRGIEERSRAARARGLTSVKEFIKEIVYRDFSTETSEIVHHDLPTETSKFSKEEMKFLHDHMDFLITIVLTMFHIESRYGDYHHDICRYYKDVELQMATEQRAQANAQRGDSKKFDEVFKFRKERYEKIRSKLEDYDREAAAIVADVEEEEYAMELLDKQLAKICINIFQDYIETDSKDDQDPDQNQDPDPDSEVLKFAEEISKKLKLNVSFADLLDEQRLEERSSSPTRSHEDEDEDEDRNRNEISMDDGSVEYLQDYVFDEEAQEEAEAVSHENESMSTMELDEHREDMAQEKEKEHIAGEEDLEIIAIIPPPKIRRVRKEKSVPALKPLLKKRTEMPALDYYWYYFRTLSTEQRLFWKAKFEAHSRTQKKVRFAGIESKLHKYRIYTFINDCAVDRKGRNDIGGCTYVDTSLLEGQKWSRSLLPENSTFWTTGRASPASLSFGAMYWRKHDTLEQALRMAGKPMERHAHWNRIMPKTFYNRDFEEERHVQEWDDIQHYDRPRLPTSSAFEIRAYGMALGRFNDMSKYYDELKLCTHERTKMLLDKKHLLRGRIRHKDKKPVVHGILILTDSVLQALNTKKILNALIHRHESLCEAAHLLDAATYDQLGLRHIVIHWGHDLFVHTNLRVEEAVKDTIKSVNRIRDVLFKKWKQFDDLGFKKRDYPTIWVSTIPEVGELDRAFRRYNDMIRRYMIKSNFATKVIDVPMPKILDWASLEEDFQTNTRAYERRFRNLFELASRKLGLQYFRNKEEIAADAFINNRPDRPYDVFTGTENDGSDSDVLEVEDDEILMNNFQQNSINDEESLDAAGNAYPWNFIQ